MSRSALLASLALHAVAMTLAGRWFMTNATHARPDDSGAGVTFFASHPDGLLVEIDPPPAAKAAPAPLPPAPDFTPPAPTIETLPPRVELLTTKASRFAAPSALPPTAAAAKSGVGKSARIAQRGSGSAGNGGHGSGYAAPQFRLRYKPVYPEEARAQRLEGTVLLLVSLDARGRVTEAAIERSCGHGILDRTALATVRSWLFEPARQYGTAIAAQVEIPFRFRFEERPAHA